MKKVPFYDLTVTDGFWAERQKTMAEKTVYAVYNRFNETGRIETMDCKPHAIKPHIFWGSDVVKWMEGAAYILEQREDPRLRALVEELLDRIEEGVAEDGYYNSYYNSPDPGKERFSDRNDHELYSLGHLIEAAVALSHIGNDRLLKIACKNADLVDRIFREEDSAAFTTPGHEEIELALVRLWEATGEKRYLELSEFFVRKRGCSPKDHAIYKKDNGSGIQSHMPMMEQTTAEGHAVRAVYLYSAVADLAMVLEDAELKKLAERLFDDICEKKMYITGGIGSSDRGERFTVPYHLPNREAYAETCAALGFALFARRMYQIEPDSRYGDAAERALFNGMISGLSLEGDAFFYSNPLEIDCSYANIPMGYQPALERKKVFGCSCCPPNLTRLIPSVADFIYTYDDERLFVHQYIPNRGTADGYAVEMETAYPSDGYVKISCSGKKLALRKPGWCTEVRTHASYTEKKGYLYFETNEVEIEFVMKPVFYRTGTAVHDNIGRVALMRGPIVYCIESKDQPMRIFQCRVDAEAAVEVSEETYGGYPVLIARGEVSPFEKGLYIPYKAQERTPCALRYIPYYTFANRGADDMQVWVLRK
ncbi:MAG: glycoside hydrolase family 127 protein [Clostridia bacterium]|nr:glycoside hydrolase family 127 protein [Clostridia bacterium]